MPPALPTPRPPRFMTDAALRAEVTPAPFSRAGLESRSSDPAAEDPAPAHFAPAPKPAEARRAATAAPKPNPPAAPQAEAPAPMPPPAAVPGPSELPATPRAAAPREEPSEPSSNDGLDSLAAAVQSLRLASARLAEQARSDALEIAFVIARRILEAELRASPEPLFALIRSAVRRLGEARQIRVRLCPADAAAVEEALAKEELPDLAVVETQVVADASLSPGDCVVESALGSVDGRLDVRLGELKRAVASATGGDAS